MHITPISPNIIQKKIAFKSDSFELKGDNLDDFLKKNNINTHKIYDDLIEIKQSEIKEKKDLFAQKRIQNIENELSLYDIQTGPGKLTVTTLPDGHKLAILNKKGGFLIQTFVETQKVNHLHSHILEHILGNLQNVTSSEKLERTGSSLDAETGNNFVRYKLESNFEDTQIINDLIKTQFNMLNNRGNITKSLEKEKPIMKSEYAYLTSARSYTDREKEEQNLFEKLFKEIFHIDKIKIADTGYDGKSIDNTTADDILKVYDDYYKPQNMTTVIITDKEPKKIEAEILKYSQNKKVQNTDSSKALPKADIIGQKRIDYYSKNEIDFNIKIFFKAPDRTNAKDRLIMELLNTIINKGEDIYLGVCETKEFNLADDLILMQSKAAKGEGKNTLDKMNKQLTELADKPIDAKELETKKLNLLNAFSLKNEFNTFLSEDIEKAISQNSLNYLANKEEILNSITAKDIQNFAKTYLDINNSRTLVIHNPNNLPLAFSNFSNPAIKKLSFKATMNNIDFGNFYKYKYPTNLKLTVNTDDNINRTSYYLKFDNKNKKLTDKPLEMDVLATLIKIYIRKNIDKKFAGLYKFDCDKNNLEFELSHISSQSKDIIESLNSCIQNISFDDDLVSQSKERVKFFKDINQLLVKHNKETNIDENLNKITKQTLIKLYNDIINNCEAKAILVIPEKTFNANKNDLLLTVNKGFKKFGTASNIQCCYFEDKPFEKTKVYREESKHDNIHVEQSFKVTNMNPKKDITAALLNTILGSSLDSIMIRELRLKKGCYICNSNYSKNNNLTSFSLISQFKPENEGNYKIRDVLKDYKKFTNKLLNGEIDPAQIARAKTSLKSTVAFMNNSAEGKLHLFKDYDISTCKNLYQIIDNITVEDLKQTANEILNKNSYISIKAPKKVLDENMPYLMTAGEVNL